MRVWRIPTVLEQDALEDLIWTELLPFARKAALAAREDGVLEVEPEDMTPQDVEQFGAAIAPYVRPGVRLLLVVPDSEGMPGGCIVENGAAWSIVPVIERGERIA